jgi:hypothetical protein
MSDKVFEPVLAGEVIDNDTESFTVGESCGNDGPRSGQWYCTTCAIAFENNLQKDLHGAPDTTHRLAWSCFEHGMEAP